MSANKIKKPILLMHGEEDSNPGTLTMQVNLHSLPALLLTTVFTTSFMPSQKEKGKVLHALLFFHSFTRGDL